MKNVKVAVSYPKSEKMMEDEFVSSGEKPTKDRGIVAFVLDPGHPLALAAYRADEDAEWPEGEQIDPTCGAHMTYTLPPVGWQEGEIEVFRVGPVFARYRVAHKSWDKEPTLKDVVAGYLRHITDAAALAAASDAQEIELGNASMQAEMEAKALQEAKDARDAETEKAEKKSADALAKWTSVHGSEYVKNLTRLGGKYAELASLVARHERHTSLAGYGEYPDTTFRYGLDRSSGPDERFFWSVIENPGAELTRWAVSLEQDDAKIVSITSDHDNAGDDFVGSSGVAYKKEGFWFFRPFDQAK